MSTPVGKEKRRQSREKERRRKEKNPKKKRKKKNYQRFKEKGKLLGIRMQKAKKYDFKDSNLALFGSPLERKVKEAAAESEDAWHGSGKTM